MNDVTLSGRLHGLTDPGAAATSALETRPAAGT